MPVLQADNVADLVALTLRDLGPGKWTDISTDLQEYIALPQILKNEKVSFGSGYGHQFNVNTTRGGNARLTHPFDQDELNVIDTMVQGTVPWRHVTTNYAMEDRLIAMNREPARIVELVKKERANAMIDLAVLMENQFFGKPADSSDNESLFGLYYWCVLSTSEGFNGTNPSGFTAGAAGISSSTYPNWANYTNGYTAVTKDDLVSKMRRAMYKTQFKSPTKIPTYGSDETKAILTNYDVLSEFERLLEAQNDNLGNDLASKDGDTLFRRIPVKAVPKLDSVAADPIYGIPWGQFQPVFLSGEYMKEFGPIRLNGTQHRTLQVHVDTTLNYICRNRRALWAISK